MAAPTAEPCALPTETEAVLIPTLVDGRWGYADIDGTLRIPARYDEVELFSGGLARVRVGDRWGMLDVDGALRVPVRYAELGARGRLLWARSDGGGVSVIDSCGTTVLAGPFSTVASIIGDRVVASRVSAESGLSEHALLDLRGRRLIGWGPDELTQRSGGLVHIKDASRRQAWAIADIDGVELFRWRGDDPKFCCMGGSIALAEDLLGRVCMIDRQGREVIPCGEYEELLYPPLRERGRLWARKGGKWGLIDFSGPTIETLVPHAYDSIASETLDDGVRLTWASADAVRVAYDLEGIERAREPVVGGALEYGRLPPDCKGLVRWELVEAGERPEVMDDGHETFTAMVPYEEVRLRDRRGKVRRRIPDASVLGDRWIFEGGRLRDLCGKLPAPPQRWRRVEACDDDSDHAFGLRADGVSVLDLRSGEVVFESAEARGGGCTAERIILRVGETFGWLDRSGRELVPLRYHWIESVTIGGVELYRLTYFGDVFYRPLDRSADLGGRRPPGEFPETAERELTVAELTALDRATRRRMLVEIHARYRYRVPEEYTEHFEAMAWYSPGEYDDYDDPQPELLGPVERVNAARIAASLER